MKCFTAYNTYQRKGKELHENTASSREHLEYLISSANYHVDDDSVQPRKRIRVDKKTSSLSASSNTSAPHTSPRVSVSNTIIMQLYHASFDYMQVNIWNPNGVKTFEIRTPTGKSCVKTLARSRDSAHTIACKALKKSSVAALGFERNWKDCSIWSQENMFPMSEFNIMVPGEC